MLGNADRHTQKKMGRRNQTRNCFLLLAKQKIHQKPQPREDLIDVYASLRELLDGSIVSELCGGRKVRERMLIP